MPIDLQEAKALLPIHDLWRILDLPGDPKVSCKSPFREDRKASFSVSADGMLFNDFGTRTGGGGDAIDFLQLATGLSRSEACRAFIRMAEGRHVQPMPAIRRTVTPTQERGLPSLPEMRQGTRAELEALAALRHLDIEALRVAEGAGLLRFGSWRGSSAWFILDDSRRNCQARRLDGAPWPGIGCKVQTLPGSQAAWPLGAFGEYDTLLLTEGGGDLLAAVHFIVASERTAEITAAAMLGASHRIPTDALPLFSGKRVRIYAHADEPGRNAAIRWTDQLAAVDAEVDAFDFSGLRKADGSPVKDLNDTTEIHPEDAGELKELLPI